MRAIAPEVAPWYDLYLLMNLPLPLYILAILMAASFASEPPLVRKLFTSPSWVISSSFFPSIAAGTVPNPGAA